MSQKDCGIVKTGFIRKTFGQINKEIKQELTTRLGILNFAENTVSNQIAAIFSEREALLWEKLAQVYHSQYPDTAEGYSLDGACALSGVTRLPATYSTVICQVTAVNYTTISEESQVLVENTKNLFVLREAITVTNEKCQSIRLRVNKKTEIFTVNINNRLIEYRKSKAEEIEEIIKQLIQEINRNTPDVKAYSKDDDIIIQSNKVDKSFTCFVNEGITIVSCTNNALFQANHKGSIAAPSDSVNQIQTPIYGWISVNNINSALMGRNLESDIELRVRRSSSLKFSGSGNIEAIQARLIAIEGVSTVMITENTTSKPDSDGRPPQSFEVLVLGGEDKKIAKSIWLTKPAGIQACGNQTVVVTDSTAREQIVKFSRPVKKYVYAKITLKIAENFDFSSIEKIRQTIVNQINNKGIGQSLIYQSLFASVYSVIGIMNADIKIGATTQEEQAPKLKSENIEAIAAEILTTDLNKIIVELA